MHGLVFRRSIHYWQDQPGNVCRSQGYVYRSKLGKARVKVTPKTRRVVKSRAPRDGPWANSIPSGLMPCVGSPALPRGRGTTGTGPRLQDRVETLTLPLGPYPRRLPLPFSRGRVQRELDKSIRSGRLTLTFTPAIPTEAPSVLLPREGTRELAQGSRIGSKPSPFPLDHTHAGSRCPSPEGGYNGNWTRVLDRVD